MSEQTCKCCNQPIKTWVPDLGIDWWVVNDEGSRTLFVMDLSTRAEIYVRLTETGDVLRAHLEYLARLIADRKPTILPL